MLCFSDGSGVLNKYNQNIISYAINGESRASSVDPVMMRPQSVIGRDGKETPSMRYGSPASDRWLIKQYYTLPNLSSLLSISWMQKWCLSCKHSFIPFTISSGFGDRNTGFVFTCFILRCWKLFDVGWMFMLTTQNLIRGSLPVCGILRYLRCFPF